MNITIKDKNFETLIEYCMIEKRTRLIGLEISIAYEQSVPVFLGVLNGSFMFMADLLKEISIPCETTFVKLASYHGDLQSSGTITEELGIAMDLQNRDVIIVEDIVDSGTTLAYLLKKVKALKPASVKIATLLQKPDALAVDLGEIDYVGFEISNEFVVGYGLDYDGLGRNLKDIYRLCEG
ncbi:hypoxanthine phosphoribosyltransferase [Pedobacter arcticus]|uniref:hypoxanthine phosphoribosyltransferase n=1 Tax=Pedobacter arcticus TaxID=752140 RepID=UPI0002FA9B88|nr:hypoxanthine phosphoribosyltransferase [Pedobacter arcticus]